MEKNVLKWIALTMCGLTVWACAPTTSGGTQTQGKVVAVGKSHLIIDDGAETLFVDINETDKEHLKSLKKGDMISIMSRPAADDPHVTEVTEVITANGTHITLGD